MVNSLQLAEHERLIHTHPVQTPVIGSLQTRLVRFVGNLDREQVCCLSLAALSLIAGIFCTNKSFYEHPKCTGKVSCFQDPTLGGLGVGFLSFGLSLIVIATRNTTFCRNI